MSKKDKYPDIEVDFDRAMSLKEAGDLQAALQVLAELALRRPDAGVVFGQLGHLHQELGALPRAIMSYRTAVKLMPSSQLASVSLFHALFRCEDLEAAFQEVERFRTLGQSDEYDDLLTGLIDDADKILANDPKNAFMLRVRQMSLRELTDRPANPKPSAG